MPLSIQVDSPTVILDQDTVARVSGTVELELKEPMRLKAIRLTLVGRAKLHWRNNVMKRTVLARGWDFLDNRMVVMPAGKHSWAFEATLPESLPETIQGSSYGDIVYALKAEAVRPIARNVVAHAGLRVLRRPRVPQQPVRVAGEYNQCLTYEMVSRRAIHRRGERLMVDVYALFDRVAEQRALIQSITTVFKEKINILPSTHDTRILRFLRENGSSFTERNHTLTEIRIPHFTQYDATNNLFSITHEVEFTLAMANQTECRVTLPIVVAPDSLVPPLSRTADDEMLPSYADALLPPMYVEHDSFSSSSAASSAANTPVDELGEWLLATDPTLDPCGHLSRLPSYDTVIMAPATAFR